MKEETHPKSIRLKSELINKIQERADKENRNFSNTVETILIEYYESKL